MTRKNTKSNNNLTSPLNLPDEWEWRNILDCFVRIPNGKRYDKKTVQPYGKIPVIDQSSEGFIGYHNDESGVGEEHLPLITFANHTCKARYIDFPFSTIQNVFILMPNQDIDRKYFYYYLKDRVPQTFYGGHWSKLQQLKIPIPPKAFQTRIVSRIESFLSEIKEARKLLDKMRRDADRLLRSAYEETFDRVRQKSRIVPLKEVATAENGRASGIGESNIRVFKTRHVYPHSLLLDDPFYVKEEQVNKLPEDRYIRPGDVLVANIAEGTLGRVTFVGDVDNNWTVDTQIMILRSKDQNNVLLGKWLYYYLWSPRGQKEILSRRSGIAFADKRGQTHIYPKNIREIPVPLPDINIQRLEVTHLDGILSESQDIQTEIEIHLALLNKLEQSILDRAFRGEL